MLLDNCCNNGEDRTITKQRATKFIDQTNGDFNGAGPIILGPIVYFPKVKTYLKSMPNMRKVLCMANHYFSNQLYVKRLSEEE